MPEGMKVLERLRDEGRIADDQLQAALVQARLSDLRAEEALLRTGAISEHDLLTRLASWYKTQFVGTDKLARASVDPRALQLVPRRVAVSLGICPVLWNPRSRTLAVVALDPSRGDIEQQVLLVAGDVRKVTVLAARPAAVEASQRRLYDRDPSAFALLEASAPSRATVSRDDFGVGFDPFGGLGGGVEGPPTPLAGVPRAAPAPKSGDFVIDAPELAAQLARGARPAPPSAARPPPPPPSATRSAAELPPPSRRPSLAASRVPTFSEETFFETVSVLVALLERDRGELRGHSARVARLTRKVAERLGVTGDALLGLVVAAQIHDLGKGESYHLTPLNVARYEGHRLQAQKTFLTPARLFETAGLPKETASSLRHLYERWDGKGFPDHLAGKDIPLGARVLAATETFLDLTSHPKNPYRRTLTPAEACSVVDGLAGELFDPTVSAALYQVVSGDSLRKQLLSDRQSVLLVDPDPEETAVLDMRLGAAGYDVVVARTAADAEARLEGKVDVIVAEVDVGDTDGFDLLASIRAKGRTIPFLFLTRRSDGASVDRGFSLGAADYVIKPASADVIVAKVRQLLAKDTAAPSRGVTGSLEEMSLPDVLQVMTNGRKTGRLLLRAGSTSGEIAFSEGAIWTASAGDLTNEEAIYALLALTSGEFRFDPDFVPSEQAIVGSTESLLLEGLRRLDEASLG